MSWLSEMFGGGGGEDPVAINQRLQEQQRIAFQQQQDSENNRMQALIAMLKPAPEPAPDPRIQQREDLRTGATNQINQTFAPGFESTYIPDTLDDELASSIYGEQRSKADQYLTNLLKRGVITDTGFAAGSKSLDDQGARVRTQLNDLGSSLLEAERGKLGGIAGKGRDAASTVDIGMTFDPSVFANMANEESNRFKSTFGDAFKAGIPGDLFDTSGLSSIAGGAQFAGNTAFDPNAVSAGVIGEDQGDPDDPDSPAAKAKKRTTSVF